MHNFSTEPYSGKVSTVADSTQFIRLHNLYISLVVNEQEASPLILLMQSVISGTAVSSNLL